MEYLIVRGRDIINLYTEINELIFKGFKPQGGPFIWANDICQAMIKESD